MPADLTWESLIFAKQLFNGTGRSIGHSLMDEFSSVTAFIVADH